MIWVKHTTVEACVAGQDRTGQDSGGWSLPEVRVGVLYCTTCHLCALSLLSIKAFPNFSLLQVTTGRTCAVLICIQKGGRVFMADWHQFTLTVGCVFSVR